MTTSSGRCYPPSCKTEHDILHPGHVLSFHHMHALSLTGHHLHQIAVQMNHVLGIRGEKRVGQNKQERPSLPHENAPRTE